MMTVLTWSLSSTPDAEQATLLCNNCMLVKRVLFSEYRQIMSCRDLHRHSPVHRAQAASYSLWVQIFIPDGSTGSPGKGYELATAEERSMARERATLQVGSPAQPRSAAPAEEEQLPEWWNPTPALHVSLYYKEEARSPWRISSP